MSTIASIARWLVTHPAETILYAVLIGSVINALLPARVQSGRLGKALHVVLDRLAALTRRDAPGTLKWPVIATSLLAPPREPEAPTTPPPAPSDGQSGRSTVAALLVVVLAAVVTLLLALGLAVQGCKPPAPDGCTPSATRCSPAGDPQVCSPDRYWTRVPGEPCAAPLGCCLTPSFYGGRPRYACVPATACLSVSDGGASDAE